ncbi:MAG: orotidine-5'-phosphate decarboxylase [Candidatus Lokiarchaeota archaeon]|nr:orotidine-5'-phosphate decarboxylase [Candidatus Lokiarchaeota archaeon]
MFVQKLIESIREKRSVVCMGLDPRMDEIGQIPEYLKSDLDNPDDIILEFNKTLIDQARELIPIIKPQIAFYEMYEAFRALKETIKYAHKNDLLVLLDSKRNDIGATSKAYAQSAYEAYGADACTLNAYLGYDSVKPFLDYTNKGVFVLVKTSNPSSSDFQDLFSVQFDDIDKEEVEITRSKVRLERNYIHMARLVAKWGQDLEMFQDFTNLGVVVGATYPSEMKHIRSVLDTSFFLIPGYGTQGGTAADIKSAFKESGLGGIVNSSRGIMFAYKSKNLPEDRFGLAAREEIMDMNEKINKVIGL